VGKAEVAAVLLIVVMLLMAATAVNGVAAVAVAGLRLMV
jgi:hypothetical protein